MYFELPDNFNGTVSDALFLFAEYHKMREKNQDIINDKLPANTNHFDWLNENHDKIHKHCGQMCVAKLDKETNTYSII